MTRSTQKETWKCKQCNTLNPLAKNVFQSTACFACGTKHGMVKVGERKEFLPFYLQSKDDGQQVSAQATLINE